MKNITVTLDFQNSVFTKKYCYSIFNFSLCKSPFIKFLLLILICYTFVYVRKFSSPLQPLPLFISLVAEAITLCILWSVLLIKKNQLQKRMTTYLNVKMILVFTETSMEMYLNEKPEQAIKVDYSSLVKIKIAKKGFILSIPSGEPLFIPYWTLDQSDQAQLTLWLNQSNKKRGNEDAS